MRYVVTELEGYLNQTPRASSLGLSCHVIDTAYNRRLVATYRSEDRKGYGGGYGRVFSQVIGRDGARQLAQDHADKLNARA